MAIGVLHCAVQLEGSGDRDFDGVLSERLLIALKYWPGWLILEVWRELREIGIHSQSPRDLQHEVYVKTQHWV